MIRTIIVFLAILSLASGRRGHYDYNNDHDQSDHDEDDHYDHDYDEHDEEHEERSCPLPPQSPIEWEKVRTGNY